MTCDHKDKLLETANILAQKIQENSDCSNPEFMKRQCEALSCVTKALKDLPDRDADDQQYFDITSRAVA